MPTARLPAVVLPPPRRAALLLVAGVLAVAVLLWAAWPVGVVAGLALGVLSVLAVGRSMAGTAEVDTELAERLGLAEDHAPAPVAPAEVPAAPEHTTPAPVAPAEEPAAPGAVPATAAAAAARSDDHRADLERLRVELGADYPDFARAARLVVATQYASAARLQRELDVPRSRARRLIDDLETEHLVGPPSGTLPRRVLLPAERLPDLERLLADA